MMRACQLDGIRVRRESGEVLGRVHEIHAEGGEIKTLICGARGFWQRLSGARGGHRIAWSQVKSVTAGELVVADAKPARARRRRT